MQFTANARVLVLLVIMVILLLANLLGLFLLDKNVSDLKSRETRYTQVLPAMTVAPTPLASAETSPSANATVKTLKR